jgi:hypothetical protein
MSNVQVLRCSVDCDQENLRPVYEDDYRDLSMNKELHDGGGRRC